MIEDALDAGTTTPTTDTAPVATPPKNQGELLDLSPGDAAKRARALWQSTEERMRSRRAKWKANKARRAGMIGVRVWQPDPDRSVWEVRVPLGSPSVPPSLNKAARLCRRLKATLMADPPAPEVTPERDDPQSRAAAEFTGRLLSVLGSSTGYNDAGTIMRAIDMGCTYDSAFRRFTVKPDGGGAEPLSILASPQATTVADALDRDVMVPGEPMVDAMGQPLLDEMGNLFEGEPTTVRLAWGDEAVTRYVAEDGVTLTDDPGTARMTWKPGIGVDVLNGNHVRMFPATAVTIADASMVQVGTMLSWREILSLYPDAEQTEKTTLVQALTDRPEGAAALLPDHVKDTAAVEIDGKVNPDRLGFVLCTYVLMSREYPRGAFLCTLGDGVLLARTTWCDTTRGYPRPLPIPLDQFKQFEEGLADPYGVGLMSLVGSGNEVRAMLLGGFLEHLDRFSRRKTFFPWTSPTAPKELQSGTLGDYIPYNPGAGAPISEEMPDYPDAAMTMFQNVTAELDDESGLQAVAQGVNPTGVTSGFHAQQLIEQVAVGLSDVKQATQDGILRGWMIVAQLVRAFFRAPHTTQFVGDDGSFREREWRGQDLDGFQDIRMSRGSFSMMAPSAKMATAEYALQAGVLTPQEMKSIWRGNVGGVLGVQDDPHHLRITRQLARWNEGPDDPESDDANAMLQAAAQIFDPNPVDDLPTIAQGRLDTLARMMASTAFTRHPDPWRTVVVQEFERARAAAGVATIAEQQQAAVPPEMVPADGAPPPAPVDPVDGPMPVPTM